jgi:hypothetical protein
MRTTKTLFRSVWISKQFRNSKSSFFCAIDNISIIIDIPKIHGFKVAFFLMDLIF